MTRRRHAILLRNRTMLPVNRARRIHRLRPAGQGVGLNHGRNCIGAGVPSHATEKATWLSVTRNWLKMTASHSSSINQLRRHRSGHFLRRGLRDSRSAVVTDRTSASDQNHIQTRATSLRYEIVVAQAVPPDGFAFSRSPFSTTWTLLRLAL
jgi:hypothetical protein